MVLGTTRGVKTGEATYNQSALLHPRLFIRNRNRHRASVDQTGERPGPRQRKKSRLVAQVAKDEKMKLRIDHIDDETSPGDLKQLLSRFGNVKEIAIYVWKRGLRDSHNAGQRCQAAEESPSWDSLAGTMPEYRNRRRVVGPVAARVETAQEFTPVEISEISRQPFGPAEMSGGFVVSKLRIGGLDESTTPRELKRLFDQFGDVGEVSIHLARKAFHAYALLEMPYAAADLAQRRMDGQKWHGQRLHVEWATRSWGGWLSPEWVPPKQTE